MDFSTDCLFHFTRRIDAIKNIVSDKFNGSYCKETLHYKDQLATFYVPTICFCDIETKSINDYMNYGKYVVGLKKEWAIKKKLNPVIYMEKDSMVADSYIKSFYGGLEIASLLDPLVRDSQQKIDYLKYKAKGGFRLETLLNDQRTEQKKIQKYKSVLDSLGHTLYSLYFTKHYQDDLERPDGIIKDYRFYDEREWRYVPEVECAVCDLKMTDKDYQNWRGEGDKPWLPEVSLTFDFADVEHIIVDKEDEVAEIIDIIQKSEKESETQESKDTLIKKVTSFQKLQL